MRSSPMWKISLVICALMVALVIAYNSFLVHNAGKQFRKNSREHALVLAAAVEMSVRNAIVLNEGLERTLSKFLKNSARFISYLHQIEPFSSEELTSFAAESGFAGITIYSGQRRDLVSGPENWGLNLDCGSPTGITYHHDLKIYTFLHETTLQDECIIIGFSSGELDRVRNELSVDRLLGKMSELPTIDNVQLVPKKQGRDSSGSQTARLVVEGDKYFSKASLPIEDQLLLVTQSAEHFSERLKRIRTVFGFFITLLIIFGALSTWWLYHAERRRMREAREYEQEMARQREQAVLGRAAGTIAHELRNPLNAINMGLQRLQIETSDMDSEHRELLVSMREAVTRSNDIITNLQQYVRSFEVKREKVALVPMIRSILDLYSAACKEQGVDVVLEADAEYTVQGDGRLLNQLFENVIKNGVEAQPQGGFCRISITADETFCQVRLKNGGYRLSREEGRQIFEPYYTSKTQGTGLGLAISRKIVEAHGGSIEAVPDREKETLTMQIELPAGENSRPGL